MVEIGIRGRRSELTRYQIGVDIGGTHTDTVVISDQGHHVVAKAPSTPRDFSEGVIGSLRVAAAEMGISVEELLSATETFVNGSTVATNVIAQLNGANTGLITTRGFEDTLRIARSARRNGVFDLHKQVSPPEIVPRTQIIGVPERVDFRGEVVVPLSRDEAERAVRQLLDSNVETIAVCLLWSFRNPEHERLLGEVVRELAPDIHLSLSHEIQPVIREYERMVTTVFNSYTGPRVVKYTSHLSSSLEEFGLEKPAMIMHSEGGYMTMEAAQERPVSLILSGPAAGAIGAAKLGKQMGFENIITADMGGTSYDTALIHDGNVQKKTRALIDEFETGLSLVDVVAIGSGGGSIAWIDNRGLPSVGPHSAGADPGPACYGKGGTEPTVTDAALILGLLNPDRFLAGRETISRELAYEAIEEKFARPLGRSVEEAAQWIYTLTVARMSNATRSVSIERGFDPRQFTYFAYGGTSPLFASEICRSLNITDIVVPGDSSAFSARGLLEADRSESYIESLYWTSEDDIDQLNEVFERLEQKAREDFRRQGYSPDQLTLVREGDLRFQGQAAELTIPLPSGKLAPEHAETIGQNFVETYETLYGKGTAWQGASIEIQNLRLGVVAASRTFAVQHKSNGRGPEEVGSSRREVFVPSAQAMEEIDIFDGETLPTGFACEGPALIELPYTVIYLPPDGKLTLDAADNIRITQAR
jgi:N-methylhydantoinase A